MCGISGSTEAEDLGADRFRLRNRLVLRGFIRHVPRLWIVAVFYAILLDIGRLRPLAHAGLGSWRIRDLRLLTGGDKNISFSFQNVVDMIASTGVQ